MQLTLEVIAGPSTGNKIQLRSGQHAKVGRTEWADFSFAGDAEMADVHFEISVESQQSKACVVGGALLLVNENEVKESTLNNGDKITAGTTTWLVTLEGIAPITQASEEKRLDDSPPSAEVDEQPKSPATSDGIAADAELEDEARSLLQSHPAPREYFDVLVKSEYFVDAIRFLACWLPKRESVWWSCLALRRTMKDQLDKANIDALVAAESWVVDPSEEHRRAAEKVATELAFETAASWSAAGAFWSGGSLAPADSPAVEPADYLTSRAVAGSVLLAAGSKQPPEFQSLLDLGIAVLDGKEIWPQEQSN